MHLTDEQLNEYLDNETGDRLQIESHLVECVDCAARLTALQALFAELDSLPEVTLSVDLAARFASPPNLTPQLPRWLTLTAVLQAAFAMIILIIAAPFVVNMLPAIEMPSFTDVLLQLQSQWTTWLDMLSRFSSGRAFPVPALPQLPVLQISGLALALTLAGASVLWLLGNGLLLRNQR